MLASLFAPLMFAGLHNQFPLLTMMYPRYTLYLEYTHFVVSCCLRCQCRSACQGDCWFLRYVYTQSPTYISLLACLLACLLTHSLALGRNTRESRGHPRGLEDTCIVEIIFREQGIPLPGKVTKDLKNLQ